jgi:hypothetical protein
MFVVLFADGRRQRGIHGGVPHNWIGVIAEECSLVTSGICAPLVMADHTDGPV